MKSPIIVAGFALLLAGAAFAQQKPASGSALPPPALGSAGTAPVAPPAQLDLRPQVLPAAPASSLAPADAAPDVRVHQEGEDTIQEYYRAGRVYMVVVTPKHGIAQTYFVDAEGRITDEHGMKPVRPVMFKLLEWGKPKAADDAQGN